MSASPSTSATPALRRQAWSLLLVMHVPFIAFVIAQGGFGLALPAPSTHNAIGFTLAIAACALQLRHSFAAASGIRPRYWRVTLPLLLVIAFVPIPLFGVRWLTLQWFVAASLAMLLPPRVALPIIVATALTIGVWYGIANPHADAGLAERIWTFCYWEALEFLGGAGLYGAARLVRLMDELRDARADLAELAIDRERLRISRDLHDLLGQSLSAVSLKGDLAIGLLERDDVPRAVAEVESLVTVARSALHDVLDIAHREPPIALASEIERAADLLASTGTETRFDIAAKELAPDVDELFAWALREGVTNVLRHSTATMCSISIRRQHDVLSLEIVNDGAMPASSGGNGMSGLAARAAWLSGTVSGRLLGDSRFRLRVEVPVGEGVRVAEMAT
jgi:two-component system sensor histidine kinase DesK